MCVSGGGHSLHVCAKTVNMMSKGFGRKENEAAVSKFCHRFRVVTQPTAHIQACDTKSSLCRILQNRENESFCFHLPSLKKESHMVDLIQKHKTAKLLHLRCAPVRGAAGFIGKGGWGVGGL